MTQMTKLNTLTEVEFKEFIKKNLPTRTLSHRFADVQLETQAKIALIIDKDQWTPSSDSKGISISKLQIKDLLYSYVRGDRFFPGESLARLSSVVTDVTTRHQWDARSDIIRIVECLEDNAFLIYALQKGQLMISPRDLGCVAFHTVFDENTLCYSSTSVDDPAIPPVAKGAVRCQTFTNWTFKQTPEGVHATYMVYVDPCGSIPSAVVRSVQDSFALCVAGVYDYLQKYGPNCTILLHGEYSAVNTTFTTRGCTSELVHVEFKRKDGDAKFYIAIPSKFANGFALTITGECTLKRTTDCKNVGEMIVFEVNSSSDDIVTIRGQAAPSWTINGEAC